MAVVALTAGPRASLPIGLAQPVTLLIKCAQYGELEAAIPIWGKRGTKSAVFSANLQSSLPRNPCNTLIQREEKENCPE